ncbi:MAG: aminotransferase class I/II-fold pyridoxal phosphate-dependent enzyme [Bdellovibrionales bacterium]|nr:aminotransferase class I/II-fold pyridoxal phosphate-dependent enzyme [Bdellovibrionales bacterium]
MPKKDKLPPYVIHPSTALISKGFDPSLSVGSARPAVFRSSTYVFSSPEKAKEAFEVALGKREPSPDTELIYARLSHPNAEILETHLTALEPEAKASAVFNSGMAAISTIFFTFCKPQRNFIYTNPIYGGTHHLISELLTPMQYTGHPVMAGQTEKLQDVIYKTKNLDLIFIETPSNPTLTITDIEAAVEAAQSHPDKPLVVVDNTFMGPTFQHPLEFGADLVVYSATKFLGGFSDLLGGVIIGRSQKHIQQLQGTRAIMGNILQPDECWILDTRLPMVEIRMRSESQNTKLIVEQIKKHPNIIELYHPSLIKDEKQKKIYQKQCNGSGSIFSMRLQGGQKGAFEFLRNLRIIKNAVSLGGMESLCCHPATTTHSEISPERLFELGITDDLVRLSIGIEDHRDLLQDIEQALDY